MRWRLAAAAALLLLLAARQLAWAPQQLWVTLVPKAPPECFEERGVCLTPAAVAGLPQPAPAAAAWETDAEAAFRALADGLCRGRSRAPVEPACSGAPSGVSCALAQPCEHGGRRPNYAASVAHWRAVTVGSAWSEHAGEPEPYAAPEPCPAGRPLPALTLPDGSRLSAGKRPLSELRHSHYILIGDSTARYVFAGIRGAYCGHGGVECSAEDEETVDSGPRAKVLRLTLTQGARRVWVDHVADPFLGLLLKQLPGGQAAPRSWAPRTGYSVPDGAAAEPNSPTLRLLASAQGSDAVVLIRASHWFTFERLALERPDIEALFAPTLRRLVEAARAAGLRALLVSGWPTAPHGSVTYQPAQDRNWAAHRQFDVRDVACALDAEVVDLWPLEAPCSSQDRSGRRHNVHYCAPGVPDIEWQLVLRYLASREWSGYGGVGGGGCRCPAPDVRLCADARTLCGHNATAELAALGRGAAHGTGGMFFRGREQAAAVCAMAGVGEEACGKYMERGVL